ncbi:MAG: UDP-3-O-(3-hydroxymyristoyl)glucosamine N-acyltransferase [Pyrinomonadaceae bacterium]
MKTQEIADFLSAGLVGDGDVEIERVAELATASACEIAFVEKPDAEVVTNASCLIVPMEFAMGSPIPLIRTKNPKLAFSLLAENLHSPKICRPGVHSSASVSATAKIATTAFIGAFVYVGDDSSIGEGTQIHAGAKIGDGVRIGQNCALHPNVVVKDGCNLGNGVILHSGVVIGTDGFGYVRDPERYVKFPQIGSVVIEDNVEIGANSCIDRGALGETRIGEGTKIDNLVQIAHNVQIGKRVIIAAQTGISGSTVIEDDCVIGGQVGMGDHARVQSGAIIGSQAGILPGKIVRRGVWWGTPVQPLEQYKRQNAMVKGLDRLRSEVKRLNNIIENLVSKKERE